MLIRDGPPVIFGARRSVGDGIRHARWAYQDCIRLRRWAYQDSVLRGWFQSSFVAPDRPPPRPGRVARRARPVLETVKPSPESYPSCLSAWCLSIVVRTVSRSGAGYTSPPVRSRYSAKNIHDVCQVNSPWCVLGRELVPAERFRGKIGRLPGTCWPNFWRSCRKPTQICW